MPPPKPKESHQGMDETSSDSDNEYVYEWADSNSDNNGEATTANANNNNNNNNNNNTGNQQEVPVVNQQPLSVQKISLINSTDKGTAIRRVKSSKYKNLKIHSPFLPALLRTVSIQQEVLAEDLNDVTILPTIESDEESNDKQSNHYQVSHTNESSILNESQINLELKNSSSSSSSSNDSIKSKKSKSSSSTSPPPVSYHIEKTNLKVGNDNADPGGLVNINFLNDSANAESYKDTHDDK
jgi:hypothetical protein